KGGFHLIGRLPHFNLLRLRGLLLPATASLIIALSIALAVAASVVVALIVSALLRVIVADREQLPDGIFHLACVPLRQRAGRELKNHLSFVVSGRIGIVTGVAGDDTHGYRIFSRIDSDLRGID